MVGVGEGDADEPVVVGKYTQTKQRWLGAKIVKFDHGKRYKRRPLLCAKERRKRRNNKEKKAKTTVTTT